MIILIFHLRKLSHGELSDLSQATQLLSQEAWIQIQAVYVPIINIFNLCSHREGS